MRVGSTELLLEKGDITLCDVEAVVNAANSMLKMGGGVAGAILRRGGRSIQDECDEIGYCPVGGAVITGGGRLRARYVIHAVGPRMGEGDEDRKLANAVINSLKLATRYNIKSIAFPAISTGIFGFPKKRCAEIMIQNTIDYLLREKTSLAKIVFVLYDDETYNIFQETLNRQPTQRTP
ncbi:MAG: macro domain-containing protein [Nitrososphaerota archaeon]